MSKCLMFFEKMGAKVVQGIKRPLGGVGDLTGWGEVETGSKRQKEALSGLEDRILLAMLKVTWYDNHKNSR